MFIALLVPPKSAFPTQNIERCQIIFLFFRTQFQLIKCEKVRLLFRTLTPISTQSSPLNLGMYWSPRATSELFSGLKRHTTLMVHSAAASPILDAVDEWMDEALREQKCGAAEVVCRSVQRPSPQKEVKSKNCKTYIHLCFYSTLFSES